MLIYWTGALCVAVYVDKYQNHDTSHYVVHALCVPQMLNMGITR